MIDKLPLKTFLESVERQLAACSAEELQDILRKVARKVPPSERRAFLKQLRAGKVSPSMPQTAWEDLLDAIDDLEAGLEEAMRSAYTWEERYGWQDEYGEDTVGPSGTSSSH